MTNGSPRITLMLHGEPSSSVLRILRRATTLGLTDLRDRITRGAALLDIELFTNDWYDGGDRRLLAVITELQAADADFSLQETPEHGPQMRISPEAVRDMIAAADEDMQLRDERAEY